MKKLFVVMVLVLLPSCKDKLNGVFQFKETVPLNTEHSGLVEFRSGAYDVSLSLNEKERYLQFEFEDSSLPPGEDDDWNASTYKVRFHYPAGLTIPKENGDFELEPSESGQPVSLKGEVQTVVKKGERVTDWETCEVRRRRQECFPDRRGRFRCHDYWDIYYGSRRVEYIPVTTTKRIEIALGEGKAEMKIQKTSEKRNYTFWGFCR